MKKMIPVNFLQLTNMSIHEQLLLEEYLMKQTPDNWVILNDGSQPAIVMGISGKAHELIDTEKLIITPLAVLRRFSGGGTVVVDENTLFTSFIFQKNALPFAPFPEPIMRWSGSFYEKVFQGLPFRLQENDYLLHQQKVGGNAQYIAKEKWIHHTSWLWDYTQQHMDLLRMPKKTPTYRQGREHSAFLTKLSHHFSTKELWKQLFIETLKGEFAVTECAMPEARLEKARTEVLLLERS